MLESCPRTTATTTSPCCPANSARSPSATLRHAPTRKRRSRCAPGTHDRQRQTFDRIDRLRGRRRHPSLPSPTSPPSLGSLVPHPRAPCIRSVPSNAVFNNQIEEFIDSPPVAV